MLNASRTKCYVESGIRSLPLAVLQPSPRLFVRPNISQQLPSENRRCDQTDHYPGKIAQDFSNCLDPVTKNIANADIQDHPKHLAEDIPKHEAPPGVDRDTAGYIHPRSERSY